MGPHLQSGVRSWASRSKDTELLQHDQRRAVELLINTDEQQTAEGAGASARRKGVSGGTFPFSWVKEWSGIGTGCAGKFWNHHPWKHSENNVYVMLRDVAERWSWQVDGWTQ